MNCHKCIEFLMDYLGGGLTAEERSTFDKHLQECPECVEYLRQYKETVKLGKGCYPCSGGANPGAMPEALVRAILAARPRPPAQ